MKLVRVQWQAVVNAVMNLEVLQWGGFLE